MGSLEASIELIGDPQEPILYVNGKRYILPDGLAHTTLLEYLRGLGLTGTKLGCGEGGCGACTVMISFFDNEEDKINHRAINACLAPLYSVEGMHVMTVEGIGSRRKGLHKVQEVLANTHGSQCGFCTPGFVMSMYALLRTCKTPPTEEQIEESLAGNLCRCTGYRPILEAFRTFTKADSFLYWDDSAKASGVAVNRASQGGKICPGTGRPCDCGPEKKTGCCSVQEKPSEIKDRGELIFPPELMTRKVQSLVLKGAGDLQWFRPLSLPDLLDLKKRYPDAKLVVGNSEVGIETRFKNLRYPVLIAATHVAELNAIKVLDDGLNIGASVTLEKLREVMHACVKDRKAYEVSGCDAFLAQLKWFAGVQIRNVSSIGGNICTASPISDLNPLWIAAGAVFTLVDDSGLPRSVQASDFFIGYRRVALRKGEILASVFLPWTRKNEYIKEFKQSHRRDDDIALVNAGMRVHLKEETGKWLVSGISLVYGGVAAVPVRASKTETFMQGKVWDKSTLEGALSELQKDIIIADNAPGGMAEFRRSLILSFFFKYFLMVADKLQQDENVQHEFSERFMSAADPYKRDISSGMQNFKTIVDGSAVGQSIAHVSAELQVSGEAQYLDDEPLPPNGLHGALVLSTRPHARIVSVSYREAETVPGFAGYFCAKDVPGGNDIGAVAHDEELFATNVVTCVGQVIGVVVADTQYAARAAALKVKVVYEDLPAILSIEDAIEAESFLLKAPRVLSKGNVQECFASGKCDHIVEGTVQMGGQEHFYLEPHGTTVWIQDGGNEVMMLSSTQAPQKHQYTVAHVLGIPMHRVVCKTKRIGGGFGGKETRGFVEAAAAAVPAYLLRRPVKLVLDREVDMAITGQRHAFLARYKVGFTNEGKVMALDLQIYNNGGNSLDLSDAVLERSMFHSDNVYVIPNVHIFGNVCFTNIPSNTAFRGFGGPQGMLVTENWIEHIAKTLGVPASKIREINLQGEGYELHYSQVLENCRIKQVWSELKSSCELASRMHEIDLFNKKNRWKKRGVAMVPTKFGISFTTKFINQAGALVQVYTDGTVLVTHGGVEMGQGLHTKIAQVAATAFDIPISSVFISETSTDKVPNASPTAASASSDMYGAAVIDACNQIKERMRPLMSQYDSFAKLVMACYLQRIDLSAHGFYITPDIGFDWKTGKGSPFSYYTYGAACAEAEIDCLTGDSHLRRVDIVMDLGHSLNPAIDIGQIEGAFVQGLGWVALEELKWGDKAHPWIKPGYLFTQGPGTYKLPTVNDIPIDFRVSLLKDAPNPRAIHSSKAVGEPPLFLAAAALFAVKEAIASARAETGLHGWFLLDTPATPERIRMACVDDITARFASADFRPKLSV
ncbi:hypothetical protein SELMODRAFT_172098 [Selaginella moellendorffii]|uniref:xanthine dehydrogenase n=1 Tax=Selaginella moellendorffii TaxID=88036 RepID=D8RK28_SELML|nr:xanthine dehydrogenase [Selaginella moellendorffii]EFJ27160.1 hypothetical protein SELMODRAFT_172098 [Selaginella moellendorffii]|eukprot:XP_002971411.1 xanthine dehydrogenase [Selaginella moellendorffii]